MTRLLQCLFASVLIGMGQSITKEYDLSSLCGGVVVFDDAAILKASSMRKQCGDITVYSDYLPLSGHDQLRVEVRSLNVPCRQNAYITLYDSVSSGTPMGHVCSGQGSYKSMYVTSSSRLTIDISNPSFTDLSLELLVTATSRSKQLGDFTCSNGFYVPYSLHNDGNNNCGDWSDEDSPNFPIIIIIVFSVFFGTVAIAIIIAHIVRCCRQQQLPREQYQRLPSGSQNYGSIQGYPSLAPGTVYVHAPPPTSMATPPATRSPPTADMSPVTANMNPAHHQHGHAPHPHGHAHRQHGHAHNEHGHAHRQHGHAHNEHGHALLHSQHSIPSSY